MQHVMNWSSRRVLAHDARLPGDELGGQLGLVPSPSEVILRLPVAVRHPQLLEAVEAMRPIGEPPLPVERLDVAILLTQPVEEPVETAPVVKQLEPRLVVHLVADDRGMVDVATDDGPDHAFGVGTELGMRVVDLLPTSPRTAYAGRVLGGDVRVLLLQPRRNRVRGGAEDHGDAVRLRGVEHRLQPVEVELAVPRLPGRPHGFADADHGEARLRHQPEISLEVELWLVLRIVRGAEQDSGREPGGQRGHARVTRLESDVIGNIWHVSAVVLPVTIDNSPGCWSATPAW